MQKDKIYGFLRSLRGWLSHAAAQLGFLAIVTFFAILASWEFQAHAYVLSVLSALVSILIYIAPLIILRYQSHRRTF